MSRAITMNDRGIKKYSQYLVDYTKKGFPFAVKNTLDETAKVAQVLAKENIRNQMTLRNKFTENSVRVQRVKTLKVDNQFSVTGSINARRQGFEPYLDKQEFGATKHKKGKHGVPIATPYASGEGLSANPRKKLPTSSNKMNRIRLDRKRLSGKLSHKQKNIILIKQAAKSGARHVYLELKTSKHEGIFRVTGGKRPKIKMVYNLSESSVVVKKNPWLKPASDKARLKTPDIFKKQLKAQVDFNKRFV